ncbi:HlyD family secretion protein [Sphingomonas sp.]|uniref:HlyD family secretion protein n=1 Tax=Sphingomonas sp. TaxID=28214 RepID=UPI000DB79349|nr:HlyD family secretion protein [Sphingomonas sp.]PZU10185.1 MAG: secretion protein HlyD [Sphingomonas sp.]
MTGATTTENPPTPSPTPAPASAPPPGWHPHRHRGIVSLAIVGIGIVAILVLLRAWDLPPFRGRIETTDNAYVRGRTTVIAPQVSGYVAQVLVRDYAQVRKGQILARIDDSLYRARVEQARADLDARIAALANNAQARAARAAGLLGQEAGIGSAQAQLRRAQADMARASDLVGDGSISIRERDQTLAALRAAEAQLRQANASSEIARQDVRSVDVGRGGLVAQVEAARAALRLAEINLSYCVIRAPEDGQLGEIGVRLGQYVTLGTQLMSLVPGERWVIANYKEAQTARMMTGDRASFTVDALGGARFTGRIERISPAAGSEFAVLKPDNATGNFVKVPQRIGIRIFIDSGQRGAERLRPGMSVETRIDTGDRE